MMGSRIRELLNALIMKTDNPVLTPVHIGVILSLSIGFIDLAVDILSGNIRDVAPGPIIMSLAATIGFFFLLYMAIWSLVASRVGRFLKLKDMPLAVSFAVFIGVVFLASLINGLITFSPSKAELSKLMTVLVLSAIFSILSYFVIRAVSEMPGYSDNGIVIGLAVPFLIGEYALITTSPLSALGAFIVFLICALLTVFLFHRLTRTARTRLLIAVFGAVLVSAPLLGMIPSGRGALSSGGFHLDEHRINRVILITVDTLRADFVSAYDNRSASTTHIDSLAKDGIVFTGVVSPAPWTLPSLSSLVTGLSSDVHMTKGPTSILPDKLQTLAGYMRDSGYYTGAIVFNPYLKLSQGMSQGFLDYNVYPKSLIGNSFGAALLKKMFSGRFQQLVTTSEITDLAVDWLKSNRERDCFLWVHYLDPHTPYSPPDEFLPKGKAPASIGTKFDRSADIQAGRFNPSRSERAWIRDLYNGEVLYVDKNIGALIASLKQLNIYDDSLIILTADHGEEFWEHNNFEHGHSLYNELLRVPLIIKLPSSSFKGRIDTVVQTHSVMPTVLDLCGISYNSERLSGSSLAPLWGKNPKVFDERPVVSSSILNFEDREALTFDGMKYIKYLTSSREELYDLGRDPKELYNIANMNPGLMNKARDIMEKYHAKARELRDYYQIEKAAEINLDQRTIKELKSLGYVK